jgi:hypothetical protein
MPDSFATANEFSYKNFCVKMKKAEI